MLARSKYDCAHMQLGEHELLTNVVVILVWSRKAHHLPLSAETPGGFTSFDQPTTQELLSAAVAKYMMLFVVSRHRSNTLSAVTAPLGSPAFVL